jgi:MFS family permease
VALSLAPLLAVVFVGFLVIGFALPVLPLHVHQGLGQSTFMVGLVTGSQFAAALATRIWAGSFADTRGPKRAVAAGLLCASAGGLLYLLSLAFVDSPALSAAVLLLGRTVLGGGESFLITGALGWGLTLAGPQNTGKVIAWVGTAMYAAFAAGAPVGTSLYGQFGFGVIAAATALLPAATLLGVAAMRAVAPTARARPSFLRVLAAVWVPGVGLALSSIGFGAITGFIALLFAQNGWTPGWPAFTAFALCFMLARLVLGNFVDRGGPLRIAFVSLLIEAAGQLLIWLARGSTAAVVGAALTGLGYSLIYPALGVLAVRRAPPDHRALSMGAYTACLDLALGFGTPALGLVAGHSGLAAIYLVSAASILSALFVVLSLRPRS